MLVPHLNVIMLFLSEHADDRTNEGDCANNSPWLSWIVCEVRQSLKKDIDGRCAGHGQNDYGWHFLNRPVVG